WNKQLAKNESTTLQVYYDVTDNDYIELHQTHHTFDIDFQHILPFTENQNLTWGTGYRLINSRNRGSFAITPTLKQEESNLFNLFVQDEITLIDEELVFTLGSKFEHNDFSGFEIQPSARLIWTPTTQQSIWVSISRAVRTSSLAEQGGVINQRIIAPSASVPLPTTISLTGGIGRASEKLIAYELGYRIKPIDSLSFDLTAFYNVYNNLRNFQPGTPFLDDSGTHFVQPIFLHTDMSGETYGAELTLTWHIMNKLHINANYSYLQMQLHAENGDSNFPENAERQSPHHKFSVLSTLNVLPNLDWNLWFRYVDSIPDFTIPSYFTLDSRLAWKPIQSIQLSVVAQNLLDNQHPEFGNDITLSRSSQVERGVYGKVEWNF
ncbi:MAG: TonB-dependent receptor, partial [Methylococcales bacterium]|nr:TonB-dependent receptor [Methylococcales bacterium]